MPNPVVSCPEEATGIRAQCPNGHDFQPPWSEKLPFEYAPIQSADGAEWVIAEVNLTCPECQALTPFRFPSSPKQSGAMLLYGDESLRWKGESNLSYFYAFVGANTEGREKLGNATKTAKLAIMPDANPATWSLHAAEIRSSRWREKHRVQLTGYEIDATMNELACAIAEPENIFMFVVVAPSIQRPVGKGKRQAEDALRELLITSAILGSTDWLTKQGFSPSFALEQIKHTEDSEHMDYITERVGRGLHHCLVFHYVSRGKLVGLPTQVSKATAPEVECADLLAFWTQRHFKQREIRRESEVPLESFGRVVWGAFTHRGYGVFSGVGFPWQKFYPEGLSVHNVKKDGG